MALHTSVYTVTVKEKNYSFESVLLLSGCQNYLVIFSHKAFLNKGYYTSEWNAIVNLLYACVSEKNEHRIWFQS